MAEDVAIVGAVLVMSAICGWYFVHAVNATLSTPTDDLCRLVADCVSLVAR